MEHHQSSEFDHVQFSKALDQSGKIIDVSDIKKGLISKQQEFTCIGCDKKLRPRTGEIRTAHFYHYKSDACSYETYLHKLGKQLFYEEFQLRKATSRPFTLGIQEKLVCTKYQSCGKSCTTRSQDSGRINLITEYPEIKMEKRSGHFIPDLLIFHPEQNKFVFVEIVVSNAPSLEKLNSGFPIIQINAESENDFDFLKAGFVSESIPQVEIHNFPESTVNVDSCGSVCQISEFEKEYFETLFWIRDSFNHNKEKGNALNFQFDEEFSCSRYLEQFETTCQYHESKTIDLMPLYESAKIQVINSVISLVLSNKSNKTKDILFIGTAQSTPADWLGAIIRIDESKTKNRRRSKYLNTISDNFGLFRLETKRKSAKYKDCKGKCKQLHQFFCIKKDMGAIMPKMPLTDARLHNGSFPFIRIFDPNLIFENEEKMFFIRIEECLREGIDVKNCYVCRYHALNKFMNHVSDGPIFCKTFKKNCHSNDAVNCERYKADLNSTGLNYQGRKRDSYKKDYWYKPHRNKRGNASNDNDIDFTPFTIID